MIILIYDPELLRHCCDDVLVENIMLVVVSHVCIVMLTFAVTPMPLLCVAGQAAGEGSHREAGG